MTALQWVKWLCTRKPLRRNENFHLLSAHVFLQNSNKIADETDASKRKRQARFYRTDFFHSRPQQGGIHNRINVFKNPPVIQRAFKCAYWEGRAARWAALWHKSKIWWSEDDEQFLWCMSVALRTDLFLPFLLVQLPCDQYDIDELKKHQSKIKN